jgi:hypothetical protein
MVSVADINQDERTKTRTAQEQLEITQVKLIDVKNRIWPMFEGLKKDPGKEMISWPNRVTVINKIMTDIETILNR